MALFEIGRFVFNPITLMTVANPTWSEVGPSLARSKAPEGRDLIGWEGIGSQVNCSLARRAVV